MKDIKIGNYIRWWFSVGKDEKSCAGTVRVLNLDSNNFIVSIEIYTNIGILKTVLVEDIVKYTNYSN